MNFNELKSFLDEKVEKYNASFFIESDPISIPHLFSKKEDIEISGFLTATIAWGKRSIIINNANKLMQLMDLEPHQFVMSAQKNELKMLEKFVHRTFNGMDLIYFIVSLRNIYQQHQGLENAFVKNLKKTDEDLENAIIGFRKLFFQIPHPERTEKHISNVEKNAAAKRLNMFLRWMVRKDKCGVDFGIWNKIKMSQLSCPLDVHSGNVARKLNILKRSQDDWKAVKELDAFLRLLDAKDPVKYDFALFGLGVFEGF
ncbi:MAG: TIGR02757 family protein [Bacteroidia bacterium]